MSPRIITLLTDFGQKDGFVATMKGVILGLAPEATIVDISHEIPPQDTGAAAFVLNTSYRYFPAKTIHVVVVDPGVGSARRILCAHADGHVFLAPDNGVLKYVFAEAHELQVVDVTNRKFFLEEVSHTFHGRDIFAPVAARLACGLSVGDLGSLITDFDRGEIAPIKESRASMTGQIIAVDRFGNLISNIPFANIKDRLDRIRSVRIGDRQIPHVQTSYSMGKPGEPIAIINSSGYLEIAVNLGNAQQALRSAVGDAVKVEFHV